ncbi:phage tail tip fiber protein [Pararhodobacter marinus]|uniref:phage tail tip fiber protein n=2 Tax=Pararhodobacter marinus TaxID=2184063 RepID=UPI0035122F3B
MPQVVPFVAGAFGVAGGTALAGTAAYAAGAAFAATTLGGIAVNLLGSVALSALSMALQPTPKAAGLRTETTLRGGTTPEVFLLGRSATGGTMVCPPMAHGKAGKTPNAYLTYVIELAGIPGHQLDGLSLNGEAIEILSDDPHPDYGARIGGDYDGRAWIRYYDGTQTAADPMLVATYPAPYVRPWTADMVGAGICYAILTFRYDRKVWSGWPQCRFVLSSVPVYDPRRDSSVGGEGPQRWGQLDTYAPSNNAAVLAYNAKRGIVLPGGEIWGGGIPEADLPLAEWMAEMDRADALVDDGDGGTEPQYRAGVEVRADDEPFSVIEELLKGCNGQVSETGGVWSMRLGAPRLPVLFFEDADIIADEAEDFRPFPPLDQIFNAISATYPDPAQNWESAESELVTNAEWEAEDGGRRLTASLSLPVVPYPAQVQRVTRALIADHRRMRRHVLTLPMEAAALEALDVVSWTSAENSYSAKLFEVTEAIRDLRTQLVRVSLREVDPADYDIPEGIIRPTPPAPGPVRPAAQAVEGWQADPYTITIEGKPRRAGILARWDADGAEDARGVRVAVRRQGETGDGVEQPLYPVATGGAAITDGILAGVYEVRAQYDADRPTDWTGWTSVAVPAVGFGLDDLAPALVDWLGTMRDWIDEGIPEVRDLAQALAEEAQARVEAVQEVADELAGETDARSAETQAAAEALRAERDRIRQVAGEVIELAANDHAAREEIRRSVQVQLRDLEASFDEQILTLADEDFALAARLTTLEATSDDLSASITQVDQARIDGNNALASLVAAVAVGTAQQFDHAAIWYFDSTAEGWSGAPVAPVASDGWLRPGPASSAVSPSGLGVEAAMYAQVRARIRAVGSPVWLGQLWWASAGQSWDAARRVTLDEPAFSSEGVAEITFTPGWSGVINAIRLDLADGADGSNYYELDWIAIGRPSPGASSAELLTEQQARISADSALASSILALEADLTAAEGAITGNANAITALDTRVGETEAGLEAAATSITALEASVNDDETGLNALASAVDSIAAEVGLLADGSQYSYAEALRNLQSSLRGVALEGLNAAARDETERSRVRDYVATATQALNTRVDATDSQVTINAEAITKLGAQVLDAEGAVLANAGALDALTIELVDQGNTLDAAVTALTALEASVGGLEDDLATKASASALNSLGARVTNAEGAIDAVSSAVTGLEAEIGDLESSLATRASASAVSTLTARVTASEEEIDSLSSAVTALESGLDALEGDLATRASASALNALTTRVTTAEGQITANASAITELSADLSDLDDELATRASSWALNQLSVEVSEIDGELSALASSVTALESSVDDATAGTTFKMETVAGPGGYARIGMMARYGSGYGYKEAGLFIDVSSDWNTPSRVGVHADQFVIATGSGLETPFFVSGGQVFMDWARIANVSIGFGEITGALQSDNYAEVAGLPVAGFRLDRETGQIKGKEVISREILELGAATDFQSETYGGWYPGGAYTPGWQNLLVIELGPTALGDMWTIVAGGDVRLWQYTDNTDPQAPRFWLREGLLRLVRQTQPVGSAVWGPERQIVSFAIPTDSAWSDRNAFEVLGGVYANVRYALQINTRTTGDATPPSLPSNHRNLFLSAERRVK